MDENQCLIKLKEKIELKREKLNELIKESSSRDQVLHLSIELDKLIVEYYQIEINKK